MAEAKQTNIFDLTSEQLKEYQVGDVLSASRLNRPIKAINRLLGNVPRGQQVIRTSAPSAPAGTTITQFRFKQLVTDAFFARTWNGEEEGEESIEIALPYQLRKTPFDGMLIDGIRYAYGTAVSRRTANLGFQRFENQVIIPRYRRDDLIYAVRGAIGGTSVTRSNPEDPEEPDVTIPWLDLNVDGRAWAAEFS